VAAGVAKAKATSFSSADTTEARAHRPVQHQSTRVVPGSWAWPKRTRRLLLNDLRSRVAIETDGQLKPGWDVVVGALLAPRSSALLLRLWWHGC